MLWVGGVGAELGGWRSGELSPPVRLSTATNRSSHPEPLRDSGRGTAVWWVADADAAGASSPPTALATQRCFWRLQKGEGWELGGSVGRLQQGEGATGVARS
jgi:hypothetical protein